MLNSSMSQVFLSSSPTPAKLPTGPTVASVLDAACRELGIAAMSDAEAAHLPPWTEEEATEFERTINEAFEQVEETPRLS